MCFSASASFGAGAVLSIIGIITLTKVQSKSQILFAAIPLIFAIQQISEGFLWLALSDPYYQSLEKFTTYTFLFFAQIIWPFWVPLSVLLLEKKQNRKKISKLFLVLGIIVSGYLAYCLINYNVHTEIIESHISYKQYYPQQLSLYGGLFYILATILPPFFSKLRGMKMLSLTIFVSYVITTVFYEHYIVSVWCFFASIISIFVLLIIVNAKTLKKTITYFH